MGLNSRMDSFETISHLLLNTTKLEMKRMIDLNVVRVDCVNIHLKRTIIHMLRAQCCFHRCSYACRNDKFLLQIKFIHLPIAPGRLTSFCTSSTGLYECNSDSLRKHIVHSLEILTLMLSFNFIHEKDLHE